MENNVGKPKNWSQIAKEFTPLFILVILFFAFRSCESYFDRHCEKITSSWKGVSNEIKLIEIKPNAKAIKDGKKSINRKIIVHKNNHIKITNSINNSVPWGQLRDGAQIANRTADSLCVYLKIYYFDGSITVFEVALKDTLSISSIEEVTYLFNKQRKKGCYKPLPLKYSKELFNFISNAINI